MESASLDLFLPEDLELLVVGSPELDVNALEAEVFRSRIRAHSESVSMREEEGVVCLRVHIGSYHSCGTCVDESEPMM
jgi:hypothetical protein